MRLRPSTAVAVATCVLLSTALSFCSREQRDENELRRYTPLQIQAASADDEASGEPDDRTVLTRSER